MVTRRMLASVPGLLPRIVIGDPDITWLADDGSGMLVYVQDEKTGSMIRIGKQFLDELDGSELA